MVPQEYQFNSKNFLGHNVECPQKNMVLDVSLNCFTADMCMIMEMENNAPGLLKVSITYETF